MKQSITRFFVVGMVLFGTLLGSAYAGGHMGYKDISAAQAKALIEKTPDLIIIDVSPAYAKGHLPKAVNYYVGDGSLDRAIPMLDKGKPYLVYCHKEGPSIQGTKKLVKAGFKHVYRLKGNYKAWVGAGYPVEK